MTSIFSADGGPIWIKFRRLVQNNMSTAVIIKIETRCRITIWRTFGRISWHVIPEPPATLQGAATWQIQCHDPIATCHNAGCCYRANSMSSYTYDIACHLVDSMSWFQSHMPYCRVQSCTWRNQCHDRATLQGVIIPSAILKIVFRHILFNFF